MRSAPRSSCAPSPPAPRARRRRRLVPPAPPAPRLAESSKAEAASHRRGRTPARGSARGKRYQGAAQASGCAARGPKRAAPRRRAAPRKRPAPRQQGAALSQRRCMAMLSRCHPECPPPAGRPLSPPRSSGASGAGTGNLGWRDTTGSIPGGSGGGGGREVGDAGICSPGSIAACRGAPGR